MLENNSYLIQRLLAPFNKEPEGLLESLASYGLQCTGFDVQARDLLRKFCRFDYMGSAEFEFGAIPKTFGTLIENRDKLIAKTYPIPYYFKDWNSPGWEGIKLVYIICKQEDEVEVVKRVVNFAVGNPAYRTKERVMLDESLANYEYAKDIVGWLELDNGYMFFKSRTMWINFCLLFNIK